MCSKLSSLSHVAYSHSRVPRYTAGIGVLVHVTKSPVLIAPMCGVLLPGQEHKDFIVFSLSEGSSFRFLQLMSKISYSNPYGGKTPWRLVEPVRLQTIGI